MKSAASLDIFVGVSGTEYVAKVASDYGKPDGLTVVAREEAVNWLAPLPIERLWGVGFKTAPRLGALGFETIGDIAAAGRELLERRLGAAGVHFFDLASARDPRRVQRGRAVRSVGSDRTLRAASGCGSRAATFSSSSAGGCCPNRQTRRMSFSL